MSTLDTVLSAAAAAAPLFAATSPRDRAGALVRVAHTLDAHGDEIVALGTQETGLTEARLRGELKRTSSQLRLFAEVVVEGAYLDARIDERDPDYVIGARPDVRRVNVPVGPVLIFAASNFPLAFSVAGGDTAAALAGGNPVVVKAHDGHPGLSELTGALVAGALVEAGMPADVFAVIYDRQDGVQALQDARIRAASFTGSTDVGRMLADLAASRAVPIPFYGELGSVNPVVVTPAAMAEDPEVIARSFIASVTGSTGQLCTKPGFLLVPDLAPLREVLVQESSGVAESRQLTTGIAGGYRRRRSEVLATSGVRVLVAGGVREGPDRQGWVTPTVVCTTLSELLTAGPDLLEESFGPLSVVVEYEDLAAVTEAIPQLFPGNLTATLHAGADEDLPALQPLVTALSRTSGRVLFGGWPTGVSVTPAMQHGGPYPATTTDATSVGTAAITRFLRAVAYQDAPQQLLPASLRDDNPWQVPQRRSPAGLSTGWGRLTGRY